MPNRADYRAVGEFAAARHGAHPVTPRQTLYAATLGVRAVAARRSAAALHGSDGFERWPRLPEILSHHGCPVRLPNVVAHRAIELGRPGRSGPHEVLEIVRRRINGYRGPDTWFERLLSDCLTSDILVEVTRQHVLRDARGEFVARFDLAVPWARLGIEGHSRGDHVGELAER